MTLEATTRDGQNVMVVHDRLRDAILRGEIAPGEATSQVALARQLGVSRTPLREALRLLEREGLVLSQPNRRIRIADFSLADLEGLYAMRIALETVAVRLTVPQLGPEDFAQLEGLMAQMDHYMRADDQVRMDVPHAAFHATLVSAAGARLTTTIAQLFDHAARYRLAYGAATMPSGYEERRAEHRAIINAAAAANADLTAELLAAHYAHTAITVVAELDSRHDPALLRAAIQTAAPAAIARVPGLREVTPTTTKSSRQTAAPARRR